ncbi:hypothetical protein [Desulfobacter sp.]|uniref:hypothetical protein n=1 Tax=Desulfobacter sp. TaxID=2294 RepID=UPI003D126E79
MDHSKERLLEQKYQGVLTYAEAKHFLDETPYTAAQINGAIKRFCNAEGLEKPKTFIDMEPFVNDLADFWLDVNPEVHDQGEIVLRNTLANYISFSIVWKAKSKSSYILTPELMGKCGVMIAVKNSLGVSVKAGMSASKRNPSIPKETLVEGMIDLHGASIQMFSENKLPENSKLMEDFSRLAGALIAGDKSVLATAEQLKQIEHKADLKMVEDHKEAS